MNIYIILILIILNDYLLSKYLSLPAILAEIIPLEAIKPSESDVLPVNEKLSKN